MWSNSNGGGGGRARVDVDFNGGVNGDLFEELDENGQIFNENQDSWRPRLQLNTFLHPSLSTAGNENTNNNDNSNLSNSNPNSRSLRGRVSEWLRRISG